MKFDYYKIPNTIMALSRSDVLEYLEGCPKTRNIWFDVLHNSATPPGNGIGIPRSFQAYHLSKNWADLGYHFVITTDGTIYLGRNIVHQGAHAFAEGNRGSMGYCLVGDFSGAGGVPTPAQIYSTRFLTMAVGRAFAYTNHTGHRWTADPTIPSHATSCPGTNVSLSMVKNWTSGATPEPRQEEDGMFYERSNGTRFVFLNCFRDRYDYYVVTDGAATNLRFKLEGEAGGAGTTDPQNISGLHGHNLQDIVRQERMKGVKGSYKLTVTSDTPIDCGLREERK